MRSQSQLGQILGVLAFVVGVVGYVAFGWRFDGGTESPIVFVLALIAVGLAVGLTVRDWL